MPNVENFIKKIHESRMSTESKALWKMFIEFFTECKNEYEVENARLREEVADLRAGMQKMVDREDTSNQYSRLDCITISPKKDNSGSFLQNTIPNYENSENTKSLVIQLFKDHLNLNLTNNDISIAHRLQPPKKSRNGSETAHNRRSIVVRFCRKDLVATTFSHCKEMSPPFFVNESLTPTRRKICYALRSLKRKHSDKLAKVNTFKGMPRVFLHHSGPSTTSTTKRFDIPTILELENFAKNYLKTTLQEQGINIHN